MARQHEFGPKTAPLALAQALCELVNPEKSLVVIIRRDGAKGTELNFRYAPLSSGLDIVRKVLRQHEIATVRTTSIDQSLAQRNSPGSASRRA